MSKHMKFYVQDDAASIQIGKNVYRRVSIPIDDFNAACDHYGFVKERTCHALPQISDTVCIVKRDGMEIEFGYWTCSECGCENFAGAKFCMECGAKMVG